MPGYARTGDRERLGQLSRVCRMVAQDPQNRAPALVRQRVQHRIHGVNVTDQVRNRKGTYDAPVPDIQRLLNGRYIVPKGNQNFSLFNEPAINKKLDDLNNEPDRATAATAYGNLDEEIMQSYAPLIPTYTTKFFNLHGSKAHVFASPLHAEFNLVSAWVG